MRALALLPLLILGGCNTTDLNTLYLQAQVVAQLSCGFLPKVETVTALFNLKDPTLSTSEQVGDSICAYLKSVGAVSTAATQPTALMSVTPSTPVLKGVPLLGRFVALP